MSSISELSRKPKQAPSTEQKPEGLKSEDLGLVAGRLSLILGHISQMPPNLSISGVRMKDGFLLVAVKVKDHSLQLTSNGTVLLDGKDVNEY